jgi:hypothetical protein
LYHCILNVYEFQIKDETKEKVCVIDSDSDDISIYYKIKYDFPKVEIYIAKNKHWEYGAWKFAYSIYPNYDKYICIQDSLILLRHIPLNLINDKYAATCHEFGGHHNNKELRDMIIDFLDNSKLNYQDLIDTDFLMAGHSSFVVTNKVIKDIFDTFQKLPINKNGSRSYECCLGLYFILNNINTHNLFLCCGKHHGYRL